MEGKEPLIGADKVFILGTAQVLLNTVCSMEEFQLDTLPLYHIMNSCCYYSSCNKVHVQQINSY